MGSVLDLGGRVGVSCMGVLGGGGRVGEGKGGNGDSIPLAVYRLAVSFSRRNVCVSSYLPTLFVYPPLLLPLLPSLSSSSSPPSLPPPSPHLIHSTAPPTHLNEPPPTHLPAFPQPDSHVRQQARVPDVGRVAVPCDVGGPFVFCRVGVAGADVARLELLELLGCAEFVCLLGGGFSWG